MNANELNGLRKMAETVCETPAVSYLLRDRNGRVVMFDISKERAEEYSRYYPASRVEPMAR